jgi:hypothetical protein
MAYLWLVPSANGLLIFEGSGAHQKLHRRAGAEYDPAIGQS